MQPDSFDLARGKRKVKFLKCWETREAMVIV